MRESTRRNEQPKLPANKIPPSETASFRHRSLYIFPHNNFNPEDNMQPQTFPSRAALVLALAALQGCLDSSSSSNSSDESSESTPYAETLVSDSGLGYHAFDLVIRDFPVTHPDFENFQQEAAGKSPWSGWGYNGYYYNSVWTERRSDDLTYGCGNEVTPDMGVALGTDGYPMDASAFTNLPSYLQISSGSSTLRYGEFSCSGGTYRGFEHEYVGMLGCYEDWAEVMYVTPNMVGPHLAFDSSLGSGMMLEPAITRSKYACDNVYFEEWYADGNSLAMRTNSVLTLTPNLAGNYEFAKGYNEGGFFPLDEVNEANLRTGSAFESQYGAQSLSIFCPPYDYMYAGSQRNKEGNSTYGLCQAWLSNGGPRVETAAQAAADYYTTAGYELGLRHLRNSGFTVMGFAAFKYNEGAGEYLEIVADDDLWLFVDGVLALDLGGTHNDALGKVDFDYLAANAHGCHSGEPLAGGTSAGSNCELDGDGTWKTGTWHYLHFFYAERQTDGATLKLRTNISEFAVNQYQEGE